MDKSAKIWLVIALVLLALAGGLRYFGLGGFGRGRSKKRRFGRMRARFFGWRSKWRGRKSFRRGGRSFRRRR